MSSRAAHKSRKFIKDYSQAVPWLDLKKSIYAKKYSSAKHRIDDWGRSAEFSASVIAYGGFYLMVLMIAFVFLQLRHIPAKRTPRLLFITDAGIKNAAVEYFDFKSHYIGEKIEIKTVF